MYSVTQHNGIQTKHKDVGRVHKLCVNFMRLRGSFRLASIRFFSSGVSNYIMWLNKQTAPLRKIPKHEMESVKEKKYSARKENIYFIFMKNPEKKGKFSQQENGKCSESCCPPSSLTVSSRSWWPFFCYATAAYGENIFADLSLDALPRSLTTYIPPHMKKFCNFKPNYHLSSISMATLQQQINCRLLSNFVWFIICFGFAFLARWYRRCILHKYEPLIRYSQHEKKYCWTMAEEIERLEKRERPKLIKINPKPIFGSPSIPHPLVR